jgi:putative transposase
VGADIAILARRRALYEHARRRMPKRWSGKIRNWAPVTTVLLNPEPGAERFHAAV